MEATTSLLVLLLVLSLNLKFLPVSSRVIEVPKDYSSIQLAVDEANPGDVIRVASGIYFENVRIEKPLSLIGEGPDATVLIGDGAGFKPLIKVLADNVEIRGFTVKNDTYGIFLWYCSGALLRNNVMTSNKWNFGVMGDSLAHFTHDIDPSNLVDGKPIYYWLNQHDKRIPKEAGYVALINSTGVIVEDVVLTSNERGLLLVNTRDALIENVTMSGNDKGIVLRISNNNTIKMNNLISINWQSVYCVSSDNNTFIGNTIRDGVFGILMDDSDGNTFYHNNFINNTSQVQMFHSYGNVWDDGYPTGGNYWSDYNGEDTNGDGIGDTYLPWEGVDYYPLMNIFDETPPKADAGINQTVARDALVTFDASGSWDNIGIDEYRWDFGDGSNGSGEVASHAYHHSGLCKVTLTVTDVSGNIATDVIWITVVDSVIPFPWWTIFAGISAVALIAVVIYWLKRHSEKKK